MLYRAPSVFVRRWYPYRAHPLLTAKAAVSSKRLRNSVFGIIRRCMQYSINAKECQGMNFHRFTLRSALIIHHFLRIICHLLHPLLHCYTFYLSQYRYISCIAVYCHAFAAVLLRFAARKTSYALAIWILSSLLLIIFSHDSSVL